MNALYISLGSLAAVVLVIAWVPLKRWSAKCRRRRGGIYLWRVDHHVNRSRRVTGYVGETVSFYFRARQHLGHSRFDPTTGKAKGLTLHRVPAQAWSDLNPVCHKVIKLPWWLCWKWVLRPLETLVILCTWPIYNDAKNHWNPRRIPKSIAKAQRNARDMGGVRYAIKRDVQHAARWLFQAAGVAVIAAGLVGWAVTR
jgi:hypothetical protein